ncbi:MAG: ABC transporter permease [Thermoplasmatota archaeon]
MTSAARGAWSRTFRATFGASLRSQIRFYSFAGWLIASLLSPIFLLAGAAIIANFLTGGAVVPPRFFALTGYPAYVPYVVVGLAANGLVYSALDDGGSAIYDEESNGTWDLLALTPMNRFVWMFAKTLTGMLVGFVDFVVVLVIGVALFGLHLSPSGLFVALVGLVLMLLALQGFGFLMAAAGLYWKQPWVLAMMISPLLLFLCGVIFPVQALPSSLQFAAQFFPLTHGLKILRDSLLLGSGFGALWSSFAGLLLTGGVLMALGFYAFTVMEKKARMRGVMGRY